MHDNDMDLCEKADSTSFGDEFANYEDELSSASHSLDEGYGIPFLPLILPRKPFPSPIPFAVWEV